MIKNSINTLLQRIKEKEISSPPTFLEKLFVHFMYLFTLSFPVIYYFLRWNNSFKAIEIGTIISSTLFLSAINFAFLAWMSLARKTNVDHWFATHVAWLAKGYSLFALVIVMLICILFGGILFVAIFPPMAVFIIYGPFFLGILAVIWLEFRSILGYISYWKRYPMSFPSRKYYTISPEQ